MAMTRKITEKILQLQNSDSASSMNHQEDYCYNIHEGSTRLQHLFESKETVLEDQSCGTFLKALQSSLADSGDLRDEISESHR